VPGNADLIADESPNLNAGGWPAASSLARAMTIRAIQGYTGRSPSGNSPSHSVVVALSVRAAIKEAPY
jgi:hypothetical protein